MKKQITPAKYWINPQFLIKLVDYGHYEEDDTCGVLIALMQKDSRLKRMHTQGDSAEEFIQFRLYKVKKIQNFFLLLLTTFNITKFVFYQY